MTPDYLSLGNLADLMLAWEATELSEGRMVELTGIDRLSLRGLRHAAINRAMKLCALPDSSEVGATTVEKSASSAEITSGITASLSSSPTAERSDEPSPAETKFLEQMNEKSRRVYYQDIVYHVCNELDRINGGRVVCGTVNSPSTGVQDAMSQLRLVKFEASAKHEVERVVEAARVAVDHRRWWGTDLQPKFIKKYPRYENALRVGNDVFRELESALLALHRKARRKRKRVASEA